MEFRALAISGIGGLALNALIGVVYGPAALGVFNQVFAGYIFLSQLAVFGIRCCRSQRPWRGCLRSSRRRTAGGSRAPT